MEDVRFFYQQANRCYQLAWQSFDLRVAQRLNLTGQRAYSKGARASFAGNGRTPDGETGRSGKRQ
jgi:hypothetical protein